MFIFSCEDLPQQIYNTDEERIHGIWNWLKSSGGLSGTQTETPESSGHTQMLNFKTSGHLIFYSDYTPFDTVNYKLGKGKTIFSQDSLAVIYINDDVIFRYIIENDDKLILIDNFYEGFSRHYER